MRARPIKQLAHGEVKQTKHYFPIHLVCAHWQDPLNVGAAFRLADAAGLAGLVLGGNTPSPPHAKIAKVARATERVVNWQQVEDIANYLAAKKSLGAQLLALEIADDSESLLTYQPPKIWQPSQPLYLVAGNENQGVAPELLALCEAAVHLPMYGQNSSMNVSVACGAAVYLLLEKLHRLV